MNGDIESITDIECLERLLMRVFEIHTERNPYKNISCCQETQNPHWIGLLSNLDDCEVT